MYPYLYIIKSKHLIHRHLYCINTITEQANPINLTQKNVVFPIGNNTFPIGNEAFPVGNGISPVGNGASPVGNGTTSVGNGTSSIGNETTSVGNETSSIGNGAFPVGNIQLLSFTGGGLQSLVACHSIV